MTTTAAAKRGANKAADSDSVQRLARLGLVGRGLLYVTIAVLAANIARGSRAEADREGAIRAIGSNGLGRAALVFVAIGFAGYAVWRLVEATMRPGDKGIGGRVASAAKAALYVTFTITTMEYVLTQHSENANKKHMGIAGRVLGWPLGRWIVGAVGVALIGAGIWNVYRALSGKFRKHLKENELGDNAQSWVCGVAIFGLLARGVAFALVGFFVVQAALTYDPKKAQGLDATLRTVAQADYGRPLLLVVSAGLVSFGLWCFVQARYRQVLSS